MFRVYMDVIVLVVIILGNFLCGMAVGFYYGKKR